MDDMQQQAATDDIKDGHGSATVLEQGFPDFVIDSLPCVFFVLNSQLRFARWNKNLRLMGGYSDGEIGAIDALDVIAGERREVVAEAAQRAFGGGTVQVDGACRTRDGRNVPLSITLRRARIGDAAYLIGTGGGAANEIVGLAGIGRDITECKYAEEAYHAIVDHSLQGLVVIQDMKVVFANRAMEEISGYTFQEMQCSPVERLRDFIHPLDRKVVWGYHQARLKGESLPDRYEFRVIRKDGSVRWVEIHTSCVEYHGRPAIQAACIDTTERRRAQEALQRSEARNQAFLNANPDLMFRLSLGGVFLDCKPPKDDAVSASPDQFVGKHLEEVFPAAVTRTLMRHIQAAIETGYVQTLEYALPGAEGEDIEFECRLVACAEREVVAIVRDISDRRRDERLARLQRDVAISLSSLSDLKEGLQYCLEAAVRASRMDSGGIYTVDEPDGGLRLDVHLGLSKDFTDCASFYSSNSRNAQIVKKGEPLYTTLDKLGMRLGPALRAERLRAVGIIPIRHDGRVVACLNVASHGRDEVPQWSQVILETIAAQIGSAISRLKIQEALQRSEREKAIILNTMREIVTYHDVSHRMLWANRTAVEAMGKSVDEIVGRCCYEVWDNATEPCDECPVDLALRTGRSQEAEVRGYNGGIWLVRGEPVRDGAGRLIGVLESALDITRRKRDEEELRRRLQFEELITSISTDFVHLRADDTGSGIERALAAIGTFVQADRCGVYLLRDGGARMSRAHEWCAEGIEPAQGAGRDVDGSRFQWALGQLGRDGILAIPSVRTLGGEAAQTKEFLASIHVKSLLITPVMVGGHVFGFLGVSAVRQECVWPEDAGPLLRMTAGILANALERKRSADALRERLAFETLLSELSATFINLPGREIDGEIERWLARIGECLDIDRGTVFQFSRDGVAITHAWAAPGLKRALPVSGDHDLGWFVEQMQQGRIVAYGRIEDLPSQARWGQEYCLREGLKSVLALPLEVAGLVLGAVSFSSVRTRRDWSDDLVQRLRLVGQVFANAMLRYRSEEALQASETRLRSIVRAAPTGIGLASNRVLLEVNDRVCEMVGYSREELLHKNARILYPADEDYEYVEQKEHRQIDRHGIETVETCWLRKDGQIIDVQLSSTLLDPDEPSQGVMFTALDITDRKRAEAQLQQHLAELTRAWHVNTLGEMASGLAHELNQPLCAIVNYSNGCLRLMRKKSYSIETLQDSIERIAVQAQRAADILKRIRGLIARHAPQRSELHLDDILAGAVYLLKSEAADRNVEIVSRLQANLPKVAGDSVEIEQVVLNLMRNAIEAMDDPQILRRELTISSSLPDRSKIEIAVHDTGRGIPPEMSETIFDSFFTTKAQGLGIGLSLSRRIIEAHGGRLWAESDGRTGATFRFTLPVEGDPHGA